MHWSGSNPAGPFSFVNTMASKLTAVAGFLVLALSPSFVDWKQSPEDRHWMILYYLIGIVLIWSGLDGWAKE